MKSYGLENRLARIFSQKSGNTVMLALDHGMALGPMKGIENPAAMLDELAPLSDSIMLNKGILTNCHTPDGTTGIVLRISGGSTIAGPDLTREQITTSMEEALRLSADAVATSIFVGTDNEFDTITSLARLADECHRYGMPLLAVTAMGKDREKSFDPKHLGLAVRVAAEMGADIIKTYYCGESFDTVVRAAAGVPIVIAGGPRMETERKVLETAWEAVDQGARGVDMGRNVWQNESPVSMLNALKAIVHDGKTVDESEKILRG